MNMIDVWNPSEGTLFPITFLRNNSREEFNLRVKYEEIILADETIYVLSDNCSSESDINFLKKLVEVIHNGGGFEDDIFATLRPFYKDYHFDICLLGLKGFDKGSTLRNQVYDYLKEAFYLLDTLLKKLILDSPITENEIWLDTNIEVIRFIEEKNSFPSLDYCLLKRNLRKNIDRLKEIGTSYNSSKAFGKFAILSAMFLFYSKVAAQKKDFTTSILLLHRAVETAFKSWLKAENRLYLDDKGEVSSSEKYTYLKSYLEKVTMGDIRSVTSEQKELVDKLHIARNNCKMAHGYTSVSEKTYDELFLGLKSFLAEDEIIDHTYRKLEFAYKLPHCFSEEIFEFVQTTEYLVKYQ